MGRGMMGGTGWGGGMMGYDPESMMDRIDGRLAFMKTELKITDAQKGAWEGLAKVVRRTAETHNEFMRSLRKEMQDGSFFKEPLPERLLYAQLDENQKKSANEIVLPMILRW